MKLPALFFKTVRLPLHNAAVFAGHVKHFAGVHCANKWAISNKPLVVSVSHTTCHHPKQNMRRCKMCKPARDAAFTLLLLPAALAACHFLFLHRSKDTVSAHRREAPLDISRHSFIHESVQIQRTSVGIHRRCFFHGLLVFRFESFHPF